MSKALMQKIYIQDFDILIVDQIGKNFSGDGADPNVISSHTGTKGEKPEFIRYVIRDLSDETHGCAVGIGVADFITKRAYDKLDLDVTYPNLVVSSGVHVAKIPMVLSNDKLALQAAIFTAVGIDKTNPKIVRLKNTLNVEEIQLSQALLEDVKKYPELKVLEEPKELAFDNEGNFPVGIF